MGGAASLLETGLLPSTHRAHGEWNEILKIVPSFSENNGDWICTSKIPSEQLPWYHVDMRNCKGNCCTWLMKYRSWSLIVFCYGSTQAQASDGSTYDQQESAGQSNVKDPSYRLKGSHCKNKVASLPPYFSNGIPYAYKDSLCVETEPSWAPDCPRNPCYLWSPQGGGVVVWQMKVSSGRHAGHSVI